MKIKSTVFDLLASGGLGNVVGQRARGGIKYLRKRNKPANPNTAGQATMRSILSALAGHWHETLTQSQRNAWDAYADAVLPGGIKHTGQNWYIGANSIRLQSNTEEPGSPIQNARIDDGPTVLSQATLSPVAVNTFTAPDSISLAFDVTDLWDTDDTGSAALIAWASPPLSPSARYNDQGHRYAKRVRSGLGFSPVTSPRTFALPFPIQVGQRVIVYLRCTNADGRFSPVQAIDVLRVT